MYGVIKQGAVIFLSRRRHALLTVVPLLNVVATSLHDGATSCWHCVGLLGWVIGKLDGHVFVLSEQNKRNIFVAYDLSWVIAIVWYIGR